MVSNVCGGFFQAGFRCKLSASYCMVCAGSSSSWAQKVVLDGQENYSLPAYLPWLSFMQGHADGSEAEQRAVNVFFLALTEGHHRFGDICNLKKGCVCGMERGKVGEAERICLLRLSHTLPEPLILKFFSLLLLRGVWHQLFFFFLLTLCFVLPLLCWLSPLQAGVSVWAGLHAAGPVHKPGGVSRRTAAHRHCSCLRHPSQLRSACKPERGCSLGTCTMHALCRHVLCSGGSSAAFISLLPTGWGQDQPLRCALQLLVVLNCFFSLPLCLSSSASLKKCFS